MQALPQVRKLVFLDQTCSRKAIALLEALVICNPVALLADHRHFPICIFDNLALSYLRYGFLLLEMPETEGNQRMMRLSLMDNETN